YGRSSSPSLFSLFASLCHATLPPSIYPLSLHDALPISYRVLPDGTVDHQSAFALLDPSGRIVTRTTNTENPDPQFVAAVRRALQDRKSTRLNSSHQIISYAVFCLKKKKQTRYDDITHKL